MKLINADLTIIGAGLTGLTLAYLLREKGLKIKIVEARNRVGGRIQTEYSDLYAPQEMGATWLGKQHEYLTAFLQELNLETFIQILGKRAVYEAISTSPPQLVTLPPNDAPSYRIQGGTSRLIQALVDKIEVESIFTNQVVQSIAYQDDIFMVKTADTTFQSGLVVSTLPPYLFVKTIDIQPVIPENLLKIAQQTHTWMGESIKVSLTYPTPFWRAKNSSGTIVSNVGPIPEMYDHSNVENDKFALKGFLNGAYFSLKKEERLAMILKQLRKYYGAKADDFLTYEETVWRNESYTFAPYESHVLPHQNNGHAIFQQPLFDGRFFIAGSETAAQYPGYMEGAVRSARFVFGRLEKRLLPLFSIV
jgi:monoamine oxidase